MFSILSIIDMNFVFIKNNKKGSSLIETLLYVGLLSIMVASITSGLGILLKTYQKIKVERKIENSAIASMDRIQREIRNANSVNVGSSSFNSSNGILSLEGIDTSGNTTSFRFYLSGGKIYIDENGTVLGPLSSSGVNVSSLLFNYVSTTTSAMVKTTMTLSSGSSTEHIFYNSAILRGSYE